MYSTADHLGNTSADVAKDAPRRIAAPDAAGAEALLSAARAANSVAVTKVASESGISERHIDAEVALQGAVAARLFNRKAYSERCGSRQCRLINFDVPVQYQLNLEVCLLAHLLGSASSLIEVLSCESNWMSSVQLQCGSEYRAAGGRVVCQCPAGRSATMRRGRS